MSDDYQRIELITGTARRRRWTTEQKLRIIEASCEPGESVSSVARRHGVAPNLLYRWRRLMAQGGAVAVGSDEPLVGNSEVRRLEEPHSLWARNDLPKGVHSGSSHIAGCPVKRGQHQLVMRHQPNQASLTLERGPPP